MSIEFVRFFAMSGVWALLGRIRYRYFLFPFPLSPLFLLSHRSPHLVKCTRILRKLQIVITGYFLEYLATRVRFSFHYLLHASVELLSFSLSQSTLLDSFSPLTSRLRFALMLYLSFVYEYYVESCDGNLRNSPPTAGCWLIMELMLRGLLPGVSSVGNFGCSLAE